MKPCNNCDKKPDCRIICKAFAKWLDDDSPQGQILENKPIKLNLWCGRKGHYASNRPTKARTAKEATGYLNLVNETEIIDKVIEKKIDIKRSKRCH
jgi:hypothetical protein